MKDVVLSNLSIYYTWKNIKKSYKNNEFTILAPTCNEEFELPDGNSKITKIILSMLLKKIKHLLRILQ